MDLYISSRVLETGFQEGQFRTIVFSDEGDAVSSNVCN